MRSFQKRSRRRHRRSCLHNLYPALNDRSVMVNQKNPGIGRLGIVLVGENNIGELVTTGPLSITSRWVGFTLRVRVIIDHLALVFFDVVKDVEQNIWGNN